MISQNLLVNREFSWQDVVTPKEEDFHSLSEVFGLSYLLVQDTLRPEHLPKYECTEEGHFFILRAFDKDSKEDADTVQELTRKIVFFIKDSEKLFTIHRVELDYLTKIKEKFQRGEIPKTFQGLVHHLILNSIRTYEPPVVKLQELYDSFEEEILSKKTESLDTKRIYLFRRKLFLIKRLLRETDDALYRSKEFWEDNPSLQQDLKENINQIYFKLDEISDNFEHLFELHIALMDQRANEVMKILTVFSTILLPLNFIASFYGMNFDFLPGLHSVHALTTIVLIMGLISIGGFWYFKRKGWFHRAK